METSKRKHKTKLKIQFEQRKKKNLRGEKHKKLWKTLKQLCLPRDLKVDGYATKENLSRQSALLMNATYIVFPLGNLKIQGKVLPTGINFYSSVIRLNALIT